MSNHSKLKACGRCPPKVSVRYDRMNSSFYLGYLVAACDGAWGWAPPLLMLQGPQPVLQLAFNQQMYLTICQAHAKLMSSVSAFTASQCGADTRIEGRLWGNGLYQQNLLLMGFASRPYSIIPAAQIYVQVKLAQKQWQTVVP